MPRKLGEFIKQLFSDTYIQMLQACDPIKSPEIPAAFCSRPEYIRCVIGSVRQAGGY